MTWVARRWWVRALGVCVAALWALFAFGAAMLFGVASARFGWAWSALVFAPGLAGAAALLGARPVRAAAATVAGLSLLAGAGVYAAAPPDHDRIRAKADAALADVDGLDLLDTGGSGNTWCFKGCPTVTYVYRAAADPDAAVQQVVSSLSADGWRGAPADPNPHGKPSKYDPLAYERWRDGRWHAEIRVPSPAMRRWEPLADQSGVRVEVTFSRD